MKIIKQLFSPVIMGSLLLIFAVAMAVATFIENDFGSGAAYSAVYNTKWFELILILLAVNLIGQLIIFKLFRKSKLPVALFHLAFIVMIAGAGITRYFGWEGTIHIREGESGSICNSLDKYMGFTVKNPDNKILASYSKKFTMTSASAKNYKKKINIGNKTYQLVLARIVPNATQSVSESPSGQPIVSMFITFNMMSGESLILKKGESKNVQGVTVGFDSGEDDEVKITADQGIFYISSKYDMGCKEMMSSETDLILAGTKRAMKAMLVYSVKGIRIVPQKFTMTGSVSAVSLDSKESLTGQNAFIFHILAGNETGSVTLWSDESEPVASGSCIIDGNTFEISYGSKEIPFPFNLKLNDFVLERYPGSNSPSGYRSKVTLIDKADNLEMPYDIYMNKILKYKGYRFYQASFDKDEKGTILSVNHDFTGMIVTYTGYALLFIFIILSLIIKNSQFRTIKASAWSSPLRKTISALLFLMLLSGLANANSRKFVPDKKSAEEFGKVLVQDQKGRTKPLFTLSNDILRKVSHENKFEGYTSMQVFLGFYFDFDNWENVPLIRVSNKDLQKSIGITGCYAAFSDLVQLEGNGEYKLAAKVKTAYAKSPGERTKMDKEIIKVDERLNILYMIYKGDFMKIFPLKDGSHSWGTAEEALKTAFDKEDTLYLENVIPMLSEALHNNDIAAASKISQSVSGYQAKFSEYALPPDFKTKVELLYYKLGIFEKLFPFYSTIGLIMLIGLIFSVIKGISKTTLYVKTLSWLLFAGFICHTAGLGMRWYIAGHSPMSNGYESMIFISWVTLLAGFIFSRKSAFALSATAVLAGMTLMVAHLSFMDPEITNLVPVLKSYWLTLHVSVITGSYGFLGLGAILGIITMILLTLTNSKNKDRISNTIDELTVINFRTITLGLYFLTIGTFLGAVWANESWGRYWGWDPKETWSLITVVIYALVTHSRMIPGMKDIYTFNLLSLFAFSSVLMTYFGVNYYLSGLHSYASGDPVPIPAFVYIAVSLLIALALVAYFKYNKLQKTVHSQK
jgi:cytochrome c-type biogenesis protein CcsB